MHLRIGFLLLLLLFLSSCQNDNGLEDEIAKINVEFNIERFDQVIKNANPSDLPKLKATFPFLFAKRIPDSIWINRINDTLQNQLLSEVQDKFSDFAPVRMDLVRLFQHIKFFDKTFNAPRVVTLTNDVDYRNKTIVTDSIVLIALDNFLGKDHEFYQGLPKYIRARMQPENIISDLTQNYARNYSYQSPRKTFLDEMIYHGKLLFFKDMMTPFVSDNLKIGYTQTQLDWAKANESAIWRYFVERELLFSTDSKLTNRFIADAPFSKFYLELDNESPGRLGQYIGWQIVRAYAERYDEDPLKILQVKPEEIYTNSKFKPRK